MATSKHTYKTDMKTSGALESDPECQQLDSKDTNGSRYYEVTVDPVKVLHPKPGYVIKACVQGVGKIFVNVCSDDNIVQPESQPNVDKVSGKKAVQWSIPYSLTKARSDVDKACQPCFVYDIIFHPSALDMASKNQAMKALLNDTAVEAVEKSQGIVIERNQLKFPKLKFKGASHPTVIKPGGPKVEPEFRLKYEFDEPADEAACPSRLVLEVLLPSLASAKGVELDVEETKLMLDCEEYTLNLALPYAVDEDKGSAKFDRNTKTLLICLPVKAGSSFCRLESTDSGIGLECDDDQEHDVNESGSTAYRTYVSDAVAVNVPQFACNVYDELIVFKLDVKKVDEESLVKTRLTSPGEGSGFSLRFTASDSTAPPQCYGFDLIFDSELGYSLDLVEVEVWPNNVIIQAALPDNEHCLMYKVGCLQQDMKQFSLPSFRAFKQKRQHLKRSMSLQPDSFDSDLYALNEKERHSSGEDSAIFELSASQQSNDKGTNQSSDMVSLVSGTRSLHVSSANPASVRGILKYPSTSTIRGRCFSESQTEHLKLLASVSSSSVVSVESSIPEESFTNICEGQSMKKSVRFSEVVQRQVFRSNSSILGQRMKNLKKAEQKRRRALGRRASEGDMPDSIKNSYEDDVQDDSGLASSMDEHDSSAAHKGHMSARKKKMLQQKVRAAPVPQPASANTTVHLASPPQSPSCSTTSTPTSDAKRCNFLPEVNSDLIFDLDF